MFRTKSKKGIACLLAVVISALMLPVSVFAAEYDQDIDVTADDYTDREGYTWDSATNTLTLTNVTLTGDGTGKGILLPQGKVTIVLEGENIIQDFSEGFAQKNSSSTKGNSLEIKGSGSLTVSQCNYMSSGSFEDVTVDGVKINSSKYNCTAAVGQAGGKWALTIDDLKAIEGVDLTDGAEVVVIYNAHLNENAKVNKESGNTENKNGVYLEYSNNPNVGGEGSRGKTPEDFVWVFTYGVDNTKVNEKEEPFAGAGFRLYKGENEVKLIKDNELDAYRPVKGEEVGEEMFSASGTGKFNIVGLDAGTYTLLETTTPSGYNTCEPITVIISATHTENKEGTDATTDLTNSKNMNNKVVNKKGSTLPSTGGMGTTIFYVVGSILVLGAAILLITKKRMSAR